MNIKFENESITDRFKKQSASTGNKFVGMNTIELDKPLSERYNEYKLNKATSKAEEMVQNISSGALLEDKKRADFAPEEFFNVDPIDKKLDDMEKSVTEKLSANKETQLTQEQPVEQPKSFGVSGSFEQSKATDYKNIPAYTFWNLAEMFGRIGEGVSNIPRPPFVGPKYGEKENINKYKDVADKFREKAQEVSPKSGGLPELVGNVTSSMTQSMAAGIPPALVGLAVGGPAGAAVGYAAGGLAGFGIAEYSGFLADVEDNAKKNGASDQEIAELRKEFNNEAMLSGLAEGGFEAVGDLVGAKLLGFFAKPGSNAVKKTLLKKLADTVVVIGKQSGVEIPSEMATSAVENELRSRAGLQTPSNVEAAKSAILPTLVQTTLMMGLGNIARSKVNPQYTPASPEGTYTGDTKPVTSKSIVTPPNPELRGMKMNLQPRGLLNAPYTPAAPGRYTSGVQEGKAPSGATVTPYPGYERYSPIVGSKQAPVALLPRHPEGKTNPIEETIKRVNKIINAPKAPQNQSQKTEAKNDSAKEREVLGKVGEGEKSGGSVQQQSTSEKKTETGGRLQTSGKVTKPTKIGSVRRGSRTWDVIKKPDNTLEIYNRTTKTRMPYDEETYMQDVAKLEKRRKVATSKGEKYVTDKRFADGFHSSANAFVGAGALRKDGSIAGEIKDLFDGVKVRKSSGGFGKPYDEKAPYNEDAIVQKYLDAEYEKGNIASPEMRENPDIDINYVWEKAKPEILDILENPTKTPEQYIAEENQRRSNNGLTDAELKDMEDAYAEFESEVKSTAPDATDEEIGDAFAESDRATDAVPEILANSEAEGVREGTDVGVQDAERGAEDIIAELSGEEKIRENELEDARKFFSEISTQNAETTQEPSEQEIVQNTPSIELEKQPTNIAEAANLPFDKFVEYYRDNIAGTGTEYPVKAVQRVIDGYTDGDTENTRKALQKIQGLEKVRGERYSAKPVWDATTSMFDTVDSRTGAAIKSGDSVYYNPDTQEIISEQTYKNMQPAKQEEMFGEGEVAKAPVKKSFTTATKQDAGDVSPGFLRSESGQTDMLSDLDGQTSMFSARTQREQPWYYSQMQRTLEMKLPQTGTPESYKSLIQSWAKKGEFKQEELEWSGVLEWLGEQKGKISGQDIVNYLNENNVKIEEKTLGGDGIPQSYEDLPKHIQDMIDKYDYGNNPEYDQYDFIDDLSNSGYETNFEADDVMPSAIYERGGAEPTKFSQWQLPGGENYREVLITLPEKIGLTAKEREEYVSLIKLGDKNITQEQNTRRIELETKNVKNRGTDFTSSHFSEPNILVHARINDRTDVNGNKTLFVEEIQSDWHQKGRTEGYVDNSLPDGYAVVETKGGDARYYVADKDGNRLTGYYPEKKNAIIDMRQQLGMPGSNVPNAPFKKTWPMLAIKRMIRYAAENGYDGIAWTTGEQQIDRYEEELRQNVDEIHYEPTGEPGEWEIAAYKNGTSTFNEDEMDIDRIRELLGKDIASKIENDKGMLIPDQPYRSWRKISGDGLSIGGEGMKGFYDQILPAEVNKYVKKWGGKVGETEIPVEITVPEARKRGIEVRTDRPLEDNVTVHFLAITPSMREAAMVGQPLFGLGKVRPIDVGITKDIIKSEFKGFDVGQDVDGNLWMERDGIRTKIISVEQITPDEIEFEVQYGRKYTPSDVIAGSYKDGTITLTRVGDIYTFNHEAVHGFLQNGLIKERDYETIKKLNEKTYGSKAENRKEEEERFAQWFENERKKDGEGSPWNIRRIYERIRDWIDSLINLFHRTARGVYRDIKAGKFESGKVQATSETNFSVKKNGKFTPQFWNWFGDSKVVDEKGEPLVVYHGTGSTFNKINFKKGAQGVFWFTSDKESIVSGMAGAQKTSKIMELYAQIKNPAGWKEYDKYSIGELEGLGYDGVILKNKDGSFDGFVFKSPTQIKSATGNIGTFDPNNPDIRYSTRKFEFKDKDLQKRWDESRGLKPETFSEKLTSWFESFKNKASREYEHLPNTGEFAQLRFDLLKLAKQKNISNDVTLRNIKAITDNMNSEDHYLLSTKLLLDDFNSMAKEDPEVGLPFGMNKDQVADELSMMDDVLKNENLITDAVKKRNEVWEKLRGDYIDAMKSIGENIEPRMERENYMRHQVIDYVRLKDRVRGIGKKLKSPTSRSHLKGRTGSELEINTDYVQAEYEVMSQILYDIEVAKTIKMINDKYNIYDKTATIAKESEGNYQDFIPDGYVEWRPREGNVFYLGDTIPARVAREIMEGDLESIEISAEMIKKRLVMGGKRKPFIVKAEVAATLDNLVSGQGPISGIAKRHKQLLTKWKQYQLVAPQRYFKYNIRNVTGDADAVFVGNPRAFRKVPQAINELYGAFTTQKQLTGAVGEFIKRGGQGATLQAQEMGELNKLKIFIDLYGKKKNIASLPVRAWDKYWETARLTTDFREGLLRYAAFLDYIEQLKNNNGKPFNYGASRREEIDALENIYDKAYWLQNDLLGAYDRISMYGQELRSHWFPFWSFKEVNAKRYYQMARNAASDDELAKAVGRKFIGTVAATPLKLIKIGKFIILATAFTALTKAFNELFHGEDDDQLPRDIRDRPHVTLGKDKDGNINYFSRTGALSDLLEWGNLDQAPYYAQQFAENKMSMKEIAGEIAKAPVNVFVSGMEPFIKTTFETLTRQSTYPDAFNRKLIRDRIGYVMRGLALENEYKALTGKPSRGYVKSLKNTFYYTVDPNESAYYELINEKRRFQKKMGKEQEGFILTATGNALYNYKLAIKYKDEEAKEKYLKEYIVLRKSQDKSVTETDIKDGINRSMLAMDPLSGLSPKEIKAFGKYIGNENKDMVVRGMKYYQDLVFGDQSDNKSDVKQKPVAPKQDQPKKMNLVPREKQ